MCLKRSSNIFGGWVGIKVASLDTIVDPLKRASQSFGVWIFLKKKVGTMYSNSSGMVQFIILNEDFFFSNVYIRFWFYKVILCLYL